MVIEIEAWPSASLTTFGCTPDSSNRLAKACLRSWNRTSPSPIAFEVDVLPADRERLPEP